MAERRPAVRNAADATQVRKGKEAEQFRRERELNELRAVLATLEGRRVVWRLLEQCGVFKSIFETSARIYYNSGRQDLGHYLLAEVLEADPDAYLLMQRDDRTQDANAIEPITELSEESDV